MKRKISHHQSPNKSHYIITLLLILSTSITTIYLTSHFAKKQKPIQPTIVAEFDTVKIPVPDLLVPAGTMVKDISFKEVSYPKHQIPQNAITDISAYSTAQTVAVLPAHLPLYPENFSFVTNIKNPILEQIPNGMRAMTLKVDETTSVEGWAGSGSIIDVLLVTNERTTVVAERVKILSAERSITPVEGSMTPSIPSTATLLVTQDQCLAINTALPMGKIAFALRSNTDEELWTSTIFTKDKLKGGKISVAENNENSINGFITVKDENTKSNAEKKQYALRNGKWIKTELVPEGFFE